MGLEMVEVPAARYELGEPDDERFHELPSVLIGRCPVADAQVRACSGRRAATCRPRRRRRRSPTSRRGIGCPAEETDMARAVLIDALREVYDPGCPDLGMRGYPQLTAQPERKIRGANLARLHGMDVPE